MFGFWKKKGGEVPEEQQWQRSAEQRAKERQQAAEIPQALRTLGQDFLPEELEILAVTGANPFSGSQGEEGEGLWPASIGLTAWIEADGPELHRGAFQLETIADNQLMPVLRQRARPDFIIRFRARRSEDGTRLLLLDLPEPGFDPELKAILDEQKKPVTFWVDGLGTFALNRALGWFEAEADWLGSPIRLDLDRDEDRDERTRYNTYRSRALTFRVLFCLNFVILAGCFIGWWQSGEQEVYIQTAVPCMVLFIVGWITRIASDFYYEFKG